MSDVRGNRMAMIFQEPMTSLNPAYTIGNQLEEALLRHRRMPRRKARERAVYLLDRVGITAAASRLKQYPHQLSGGLRQRVMIAMALMCGPSLILADEPTTALDVTIQAQILHLLAELQREFAMGLVLITHDLGIVARIATRVVVMYAGQVAEAGPAAAIFAAPAHPYTQGLLACIPVPGRTRRGDHLGTIPGLVPSLVGEMRGCHFAGRCPHVDRRLPAVRDPARGRRRRAAPGALHPPRRDRRLRRATAQPRPRHEPRRARSRRNGGSGAAAGGARCLAHLPGLAPACSSARRRCARSTASASPSGRARWWRWSASSGCGKTTLARMLLGLLPPSAGEIRIDGRPAGALARREIASLIQPVFQDPYSSLNPRKPIGSIIALPLRVQRASRPDTWRAKVEDMMERVGLARALYDNYPSQLSGGQRQRVAIARALINRPRMVICDEPTSALDVSVQSQILNLLQDLRRDLGLTYLLISHNLAVVEHMATRVAVMYLGRIVEEAETDRFFRAPKHPYGAALLASVLTPEPGLGVPDTQLGAAYPDPLDVPAGCRFHPRCARVMPQCKTVAPKPIATDGGFVECHLYDPQSQPGAPA